MTKFHDPTCPRTLEHAGASYVMEQMQNAVANRQAFMLQQQQVGLTMLQQQREAGTASFLGQIAAIKDLLRNGNGDD